MANFELLIRNALASQDAGSEQTRAAVYQSSRNALKRILNSNTSMSIDVAMAQQEELEECISRIEAEYTQPPPAPEEPDPFVDENDPLYEIQQILTGGNHPPKPPAEPQSESFFEQPVETEVDPPLEVSIQTPSQMPPEENPYSERQEPIGSFEVSNPYAEQPQPEVPSEPQVEAIAEPQYVDPNSQSLNTDQKPDYDYAEASDEIPALGENDYIAPGNAPAGFTQRRKKQRIGIWVIITLLFLGLLGWGGYYLYLGLQDGSLLNIYNKDENNRNPSISSQDADEYITVVNANDLSALIVAGRGEASLVTQLNMPMIRVKSTRDKGNPEQAAEPLLLRLKPGVLDRISGRKVMLEIHAKSGSNKQAQYSVSCQFANGSDCGRKRFVAGIQPQSSIFEFDLGEVPDNQAEYFIELKTDTTSDAILSGEGDILDIVYIRLKPVI